MMRSLSTRAFGQPSETKLTFGAIVSSIGVSVPIPRAGQPLAFQAGNRNACLGGDCPDFGLHADKTRRFQGDEINEIGVALAAARPRSTSRIRTGISRTSAFRNF